MDEKAATRPDIIESRKVRDFLTLKPYEGIYTFDNLSPETILKSYIFTTESSKNLQMVFNELVKPEKFDRRSVIISGDRGVGKTHSLAVIRELLKDPSFSSKISAPNLKPFIENLSQRKFIVLDIHCLPHQEGSLKELFYQQFSSAIMNLSSGEIPPLENWMELTDSDQQLKFIADLIPDKHELIILLDDLSEKILSYQNIAKVLGDLEFILAIAQATSQYSIFLVTTFFRHLIDPPSHTAKYRNIHQKIVEVQLTQSFLLLNITKKNILELVNRNIIQKTDQQRQQLKQIYSYMSKTFPFFKQDPHLFVDTYPIHPMVFRISFYLHRYIKNFSLISFFYSTANKIMGYRCTALATIDLVFDLLYHEFKKIDDLRMALSSYDTIQKKAIGSMLVSQRLMARLILKATFLLSITVEYTPTVDNIISALLLSDYKGKPITGDDVQHVLDYFVEHCPECIRKHEKDDHLSFQIVSARHSSLEQVLKEIRKEEKKLEEKREKVIFHAVCRLFHSLGINTENISIPFSTHPLNFDWRGTHRIGLATWADLYDQIHLQPIELRSRSALQLIMETGNLDQASQLAKKTAPPPIPESSALAAALKETTPDWQLMVLSPFSGKRTINRFKALRKKHSTLLVLQPAMFTEKEKRRLELTALLLSEEHRSRFSDVNLEDEFNQRRDAEEKFLFELLKHKYISEGLLFYGDTSVSLDEKEATPESIIPVIQSILKNIYDDHFPLHPTFDDVSSLDKNRFKVVTFLLNNTLDVREAKKIAEQILLPLEIVQKSELGYTFEPDNDAFIELPYISDIICLVSTFPRSVFGLALFYNVLATSPYGFQPPIIDVILFSLVAAGKIKIFKSDRVDMEVINQMSLSGEIDLGFFDSVQAMEGKILPLPELLLWGFTLCEKDFDTSGNTSQIRRQLRKLLDEWLENEKSNSLEQLIKQIPNDMVTTNFWGELQSCYRNENSILNIVENICNRQYSLEDGLSSLAQTFSNNLQAFQAVLNEIVNIRDFLRWNQFFLDARNYILISEKTKDKIIENLRYDLSSQFERPIKLIDPTRRKSFQQKYDTFKERYIAYYKHFHDHHLLQLSTDSELSRLIQLRWWKNLPHLARIVYVDHHHLVILNSLLSSLNERECRFPVSKILEISPTCACGFRLHSSSTPNLLVKRIVTTAKCALAEYQNFFSNYKKLIIREMQKIPSLEDETARQVINLVNGNFDKALDIDAVKLVNFILKRRVKTVSQSKVEGVSSGNIVSRSDLMHNLVRFSKELEESKHMYYLIDVNTDRS